MGEEAKFEYMSVHSESQKARWGGENDDRNSENNQ
jgi:hypothetical protein